MTAVKISGTFSKDERPDNGLEAIADELLKDKYKRHTVVGVVELRRVTEEVGEAPVPTVGFVAIEPLADDAADQARQILDQARNARGRGHVAETLPFDNAADDGPVEGHDDDGPVAEKTPDVWLDENGDKP